MEQRVNRVQLATEAKLVILAQEAQLEQRDKMVLKGLQEKRDKMAQLVPWDIQVPKAYKE